jgi:hypothetical protein
MVTLSYSAIKLLRTDPAEYERLYICGGERRKENDRQIEGMILHDKILSPDVVRDKYVIIPEKPTSPMMLSYLETLANLINAHLSFEESINPSNILACEQQAYKKSGYTESFESVKEKSLKYDDYFKFCLLKDTKYGISEGQLSRVDSIIDNTSSHLDLYLGFNQRSKAGNSEKSLLSGLVSPDRTLEHCIVNKTLEQYWEFSFSEVLPLTSKTTGKRVNILMRGSIDYIFVSHKNKHIYIKDLKKVEDLFKFRDFYQERKLDLQAGVYYTVVNNFLEKNKLDYNLSFQFVVVDDCSRIYQFPLHDETMKKILKKTQADMDMAYYHIVTRQFGLPYEYLKKEVQL